MIDLKKIKELIKLMVVNDLTELDLEGDGERVTLKRGHGNLIGPEVKTLPAVAAGGGPGALLVASAAGESANRSGQPGEPEKAEDGLKTIASPMVGSFYAAPSPDAKPFVSIGDRVNAETVVCVVEAMKVFNEIKAEASGTIEKVLVENGQAVEFDQPLFLVRSD